MDNLKYIKFLDSFDKVNENKLKIYKRILSEATIEIDDFWSQWYNSGGYNYTSDNALEEFTCLTYLWDKNKSKDLTCLDVGSGDGFWSFMLSYFYKVTGIEPVESAVYLSNQYKKEFKSPINDAEFIVGDALTHDKKYDVLFCRAPQFFNYPMTKKFNKKIKDVGYKKLFEYWRETADEQSANEMIKRYQSRGQQDAVDKYLHYSNNAKKYLSHLVSITNECLIFIMSSKSAYFRKYLGGTYNHHPDDVRKLFSEFGSVSIVHKWDSYLFVTLKINKI
mgnify:FL=1